MDVYVQEVLVHMVRRDGRYVNGCAVGGGYEGIGSLVELRRLCRNAHALCGQEVIKEFQLH